MCIQVRPCLVPSLVYRSTPSAKGAGSPHASTFLIYRPHIKLQTINAFGTSGTFIEIQNKGTLCPCLNLGQRVCKVRHFMKNN